MLKKTNMLNMINAILPKKKKKKLRLTNSFMLTTSIHDISRSLGNLVYPSQIVYIIVSNVVDLTS